MCCFSGSVFVSTWSILLFVSSVCPVAMRSMVFCTVWMFFVFVSLIMGDHMVLAYSSIGRVMAVYVCVIVSFVFPQLVPVIALYMFIDFCAFVFVCFMCSLYASFGSSVKPNIFG